MKSNCYLRVYNKDSKEKIWLSKKAYKAGKGFAINLKDKQVKAEHFEINNISSKWKCIVNHVVKYNGNTAKPGEIIILHDGDFIEVGSSKIIFLCEANKLKSKKDKIGDKMNSPELFLQHLMYPDIKFKFQNEFTFIGRLEKNDIVIPLEGVSDMHAMVFQKEGNFYIVDLVSRLGTTLNNDTIVSTSLIKNGDQIAFDRQVFAVVDNSSIVNKESRKPVVNDDVDGNKTIILKKELEIDSDFYLIIEKGSDKGRQIPLDVNSKILISRKKINDNTIIIDDPSISRQGHCLLFEENNNWRIIDQGSTNGILVNNKSVTTSELIDGDTITLGEVLLSFHSSDDNKKTVIGNVQDKSDEETWDVKTIVDTDKTIV